MLSVSVTPPLGGIKSWAVDQCMDVMNGKTAKDKADCEKIVENIDDPKVLAGILAGMAATAACSAAVPALSGVASSVCGPVGAYIGGKMYSVVTAWGDGKDTSCTGTGGTAWAIEEFMGGGGGVDWHNPIYWRRVIPRKITMSGADPRNHLCMERGWAKEGCATVAYCQAPGMPSPKRGYFTDIRRSLTRGAKTESKGVFISSEDKLVGGKPYAISAFDPSIQRWRVAVPVAKELSGPEVDPSDKIIEVGTLATKPSRPNVVILSLSEYKKLTRAWYKKPVVWLAALGVAGASVYGYKRWRSR